MDERSLQALELDKILEFLGERCMTALGRELALSLCPSPDIEEVRLRQRETTQARRRLERDGQPPLGGISDLRPLLERADRGEILEPQEFLTIAQTLSRIAEMKAFLQRRDEQDCLSQQAQRIGDHARLIARIRWCLGEEGQVLDRASDRLSRLRRQKQSVQRKMQNELQKLLRDPSIVKMLREPYYTVRDGRYCLPVKAEFRTAIQGLVHGKSSSGLTLFVEPDPLVPLGNELRELESEEAQEIARILRELTGEVVGDLPKLRQTLEALGRIDFAFAKAKLSRDLKAYEPELNTVGVIRWRRARHPLLHLQGFVVPIDFELGTDFDVLVITGPNTGGKTVTLKTVGLLTLMAQCGLHIPAAEGAKVAVFEGVFADIGDEQSIEQNLSTFSSHMTHIVKALQSANEKTLVLLDEIGAGTDPMEGAALAKALLLYLHRKGAKVVCTTHFGDLKDFAFRQHRFQNASVLFDPETLRPTYRLVIGLPGQSHAFDIAKGLGVPEEVIDDARKLMPRDRRETEELMSQLSVEKRSAEQLRREWERKIEELRERETRVKEREERLREEERVILERARRRGEQLLRRVEGQVEELLKALRRRAILPEQVRAKLQALRELLPSVPSPFTTPPILRPCTGMMVRIHPIGVIGKIIALDDGGKKVQVQVGGMRVWVSPDQLEPVPETSPPSPTEDSVASVRVKKMVTVPTEVNLLGMRVDEALAVTEKFLDDAFLAGHKVVRIIHGRGTGRLRQAIHDFLRTHPHVQAFELAPLHQGGEGVTLVSLRL